MRVGGRFAAMKGKSAAQELTEAKNAIAALGGRTAAVHDFLLGDAGERSIIMIEKTVPTPDLYPRRSKLIKNKPL